MSLNSFWAHGVSIVPEFTKEFTNTDNGLYMRRAGWGTLIKQKGGSGNWFHIPIPSPSFLDTERTYLNGAWLRFKINTQAVIKNIHVRQNIRNSEMPRLFRKDDYTIAGQDTTHYVNFGRRINCHGPIVISIYIWFENDDGELLFTGAGACFHES